jgi:hypothetical protein
MMTATSEQQNVIIRQDEYVTVQVDTSERMVTLSWTGYAPSEVYRSILECGLDAVAGMGLTRWLADLRGMDAILQQDEQWTVSDWFPRLGRTGLKRMAILTSSDYFNQMSVDRIMTAATPAMPFAVAYFDKIENARVWLLA